MIARKSAVILANSFVGGFLGLTALFFIARYMTAAGFGMVTFATSVAGLVSSLFAFGFHFAHAKRVSEGVDLGRCMTTYSVIAGTLASAFLIVTVLAVWWWDRYQGFIDGTTASVMVIVAIGTYFGLLRTVPMVTFDALRQTARTQLVGLVENLVRIPFTVVFALAFAAALGADIPGGGFVRATFGRLAGGPPADEVAGLLIAVAQVLSILAGLAVGLYLIRRHRFPFGPFDRALARRYFEFAWPFALLALMTSWATDLDKLLLGYFWSSTDVGRYAGAQRLGSLIMIVPSAVGVLLFPTISGFSAGGEHGNLARLSLQTQRYTSLIAVPLATFFFVFPRETISLVLSNDYLPATPILRLLAFYYLALAFTIVPSSVVSAMDRPRLTAAILAGAIGLDGVLNVLLIPTSILGVPLAGLGGVGAAGSTLAAQALSLAAFVLVARRLTRTTMIPFATLRHALAAAAVGALAWAAVASGYLPKIDRVWEVGAAFGALMGLYAGALVALRELTMEDYRLVWDVVHPGRMAAYVKDELRPPE